MTKISAIISTRNEETNIRYCLETLLWCDEIIIIDMESEDNTVKIAKEYTNKIYNHPKVLAFDIARKYALEKATGDWILQIDADEMIPKELASLLLNIVSKNDADIIEIPFRHYIMGSCVHYSGWGYTHLPRFFRHGKVTYTETIHDYIHKAAEACVVQLEAKDEICIIHFNYTNSSHFVEKLNRYTSVEAQHLFDKGARFSYYIIFDALLREFYNRYFRRKGYKGGVRGFSLSLMMTFYRALTYIKLWELHEFKDKPVDELYDELRQNIIKGWK